MCGGCAREGCVCVRGKKWKKKSCMNRCVCIKNHSFTHSHSYTIFSLTYIHTPHICIQRGIPLFIHPQTYQHTRWTQLTGTHPVNKIHTQLHIHSTELPYDSIQHTIEIHTQQHNSHNIRTHKSVRKKKKESWRERKMKENGERSEKNSEKQ